METRKPPSLVASVYRRLLKGLLVGESLFATANPWLSQPDTTNNMLVESRIASWYMSFGRLIPNPYLESVAFRKQYGLVATTETTAAASALAAVRHWSQVLRPYIMANLRPECMELGFAAMKRSAAVLEKDGYVLYSPDLNPKQGVDALILEDSKVARAFCVSGPELALVKVKETIQEVDVAKQVENDENSGDVGREEKDTVRVSTAESTLVNKSGNAYVSVMLALEARDAKANELWVDEAPATPNAITHRYKNMVFKNQKLPGQGSISETSLVNVAAAFEAASYLSQVDEENNHNALLNQLGSLLEYRPVKKEVLSLVDMLPTTRTTRSEFIVQDEAGISHTLKFEVDLSTRGAPHPHKKKGNNNGDGEEDEKDMFQYSVAIRNTSEESCPFFAVLVSRDWTFVDVQQGTEHRVQGFAVVGEHPALGPGEEYVYSSGTMSSRVGGYVKGALQFEVHTPALPAIKRPIVPVAGEGVGADSLLHLDERHRGIIAEKEEDVSGGDDAPHSKVVAYINVPLDATKLGQ